MRSNGSIIEDIGMKKFSLKNVKFLKKQLREIFWSSWRMFKSLIAFTFNPKWEVVTFFMLYVITPILEAFDKTSTAGAIVGDLYSNYFTAKMNEKNTGSKTTILPDLEKVNLIINEYKMVKMFALGGLFMYYGIVAETVAELQSTLLLSAVTFGAVGSLFQSAGFFAILWGVLATIGYYGLYLVMAWLFIVVFRFVFVMLREINRVDSEEINTFIGHQLVYVTQKAKEIAGEEIALISRQAVLETLAVKTDNILSAKYDTVFNQLQHGQKALIRKKEPNSDFDDEAPVIENKKTERDQDERS